MLLSYSNFISERFEILQTDSPGLASQKNQFNQLEVDTKEFLQKRIELDNIYLTYKDEGDLINKLSARGFIDKTANKKQLVFKNPLFSIYSGASEKSRSLKDLEKSIEELSQKIKEKKDYLQKNPNSQESVGGEISTLDKELQEKNNQLQKLSKEIIEIQRVSNERLKEMTDNLKDTNKQIRSSRE